MGFVGSSVDGDQTTYDDGDGFFEFPTASRDVDPTVKEEGEQLFEHFVREQIGNSDLIKPCLKMVLSPRTPARLSKTDLAEAAAHLCRLAASFAETEERQQVKETALKLSPNMTSQDLATVLITMIKETHHLEEGIVVLFYFCFDLALRMLDNGVQEFWEFLSTCKEGIVLALGPQVQANGGLLW